MNNFQDLADQLAEIAKGKPVKRKLTESMANDAAYISKMKEAFGDMENEQEPPEVNPNASPLSGEEEVPAEEQAGEQSEEKTVEERLKELEEKVAELEVKLAEKA